MAKTEKNLRGRYYSLVNRAWGLVEWLQDEDAVTVNKTLKRTNCDFESK